MPLLPYVVAFVCIVFAFPGHAEPKRFQSVSVADGLAQNSVYSIIQRDDGQLWIGTADGLSVYDGSGFRNFYRNRASSGGLQDNYISSLIDLGGAGVLVGTQGGGLSLLDPVTLLGPAWKSGTSGSGLPHDDINHLAAGPDNSVLIATSGGLAWFDITRREILSGDAFPLPGLAAPARRPMRLSLTLSDRRILLGFAEGGGILHDIARGTSQAVRLPTASGVPPPRIQSAAEDAQGRIWLATDSLGLLVSQPDGRFVPPELAPGDRLPDDIMYVLPAGDGRLWIATWTEGVFRYDPQTRQLANFRAEGPHSPGSNALLTLFIDRTGSLWVGTFDAGLSQAAMTDDPFTAYFPDDSGLRGPVNPTIWALEPDGTDGLWVGTREGMSRLDRSSHRFRTVALPDGIRDIRALLTLPQGLLIASYRNGLHLMSPSGQIHPAFDSEPFPGFATVQHRLLHQDRNGLIWLGTHQGLFLFSPELAPLAHFAAGPEPDRLPHNRIRAIYEAPDGTIWIGTSGGLSRHMADRPGLGTFETFTASTGLLPDDDVRAIHIDAARPGQIFAGTGGGLAILTPATRQARFLLREDGLPNETFYSLVPDHAGRLWAGTNNGLVRIDTRDLSMTTYRPRDGLPMAEFNFNAWTGLADGNIAMGGIGGLVLFDPDRIGTSDAAPVLSLGDAPWLTHPVTAPATLELAARVVHFAEPDANRLHWRLNNGAWRSATGTRHNLILPDLDWGDHRLELAGESSGGQRSAVRSLSFHIGPPFWARPGFIVLTAASLAMAVLLGALVMRGRARRHAIRLEAIISQRTGELTNALALAEQRREEIAANALDRNQFFGAMSHELKTPLSVVRSALERLQERGEFARGDRPLLGLALRGVARLGLLAEEMATTVSTPRADLHGRIVADIESTVAAMVDGYASQAADRDQQLQRLDAADLGVALVNPVAIDRILSNLLSNAVRHASPGSRIDFTAGWTSDQGIRFIVTTAGPPLPEADFLAARRFLTDESGRPALRGLEIICDTLRRAGGSIARSGDGLCLTVDIPARRQAALIHSGTGIAANFLPDDVPAPAPPGWITGRHILIVEDSREIATLLAMILAEDGIRTTIRSNVKQARLVLERDPVDILICDVQLPGGTGIELGQWLRGTSAFAHIPLIYVTAADLAALQPQTDALVAEAVIGKPFHAADIRRTIRRVLRTIGSNVDHSLRQARAGSGIGAAAEGSPGALGGRDQRILRELALMFETEPAAASVTRLAGRLAMSRRSLERQLPGLFGGASFGQLLRRHRVTVTQAALRRGERLSAIAQTLGLADARSLSRIFEAETGLRPEVWLAQDSAADPASSTADPAN